MALLTTQERARAAAALIRLAAADRESGRFQQLPRRAADEDSSIDVQVIVHDGPLGNGRTIIVEKQVGNVLVRKTRGDEPYGQTQDWVEINLNNLVHTH